MTRVTAPLLLLGLLLFTFNASATKPCPMPPCSETDTVCWEQQATWIAVGTISDVRHHPMGMPLMKDFASYVLGVKSWEKTQDQRQPQLLSMQVGWCDSGKELPRDLSGTFRFYGKLMAAEPDAQGTVAVDYITYLRASCPKAHCNDEPPGVSPDARSRGESRERPPLFGPVGSPDVPPGATSATPSAQLEVATAPAPTTPSTATTAQPTLTAEALPAPAPPAATPNAAGPQRCGCNLPGENAGNWLWSALVLGLLAARSRSYAGANHC